MKGRAGREQILMSFRLFWHIIAIRPALPRGVLFWKPENLIQLLEYYAVIDKQFPFRSGASHLLCKHHSPPNRQKCSQEGGFIQKRILIFPSAKPMTLGPQTNNEHQG